MPLRLRCGLTVAVTLVALGYGLAWRLGPQGAVEPTPWRARVAPVAAAPIPSGTVVTLVPPAAPKIFREFLRFEAAWLRPDLLWRNGKGWPESSATEWVVVIGPRPQAAGWAMVWREGDITVLRRVP